MTAKHRQTRDFSGPRVLSDRAYAVYAIGFVLAGALVFLLAA